ncbi:MAG: hypothetical protein GF409_07255 [Candidatus Omnitrophica bacterium]|nr:hypothetical protein [Candidatus Omnitrophota bacterium]
MTNEATGKTTFQNSESIVNYNTLLSEHTASLLRRFGEPGIPVMLLKGIALVNDVYADTSDRVMGDIDLLVRKEHSAEAEKILRKNGFVFIQGNMANARVYGKTEPLEIYVDLHTGLVNPQSPSQSKVYSPDIDSIWRRAREVDFSGNTAFTLSAEDRIVYLAFHMLKERFSKDKWFRDLVLVIEHYAPRVDKALLESISRECGTHKLCCMIIDHLKDQRKEDIRGLDAVFDGSGYFLYRFESRLFRALLAPWARGLFPLREFLWLIAMDSARKKASFTADLIRYLPIKMMRTLRRIR